MYTEHLHHQLLSETVQTNQYHQDQERTRRMHGVVTQMSLRDENVLFDRTRGVSGNNRSAGFIPAYRNMQTGEQVPSRFPDGALAPVHLLDGLPESWIAERDSDGHVVSTCPGIVSGFLRGGQFYTREEAARTSVH